MGKTSRSGAGGGMGVCVDASGQSRGSLPWVDPTQGSETGTDQRIRWHAHRMLLRGPSTLSPKVGG